MKLDEDQLVAACLKNDQNAYRQLYERFAPSMLGLCMRYVKDRDAAQDVLHDGFIKVFEKLNTLHANQSLGSWIYTIMLNTARNSIRTPLPVGLIEDTDPNMVQGSVPANALMQFDTEQIVLAMSRLSDSQRLFFNLHEVEGYSYEELAQQYQMKEATIRSIVFRARNLLIDILTSQPNE